jgi:hypothetical protein
MEPNEYLEEVLDRIDPSEPRVNVGIGKTHHKLLKMIAAQRGHSVQQTVDILLQRTLVEIKDVRITDFMAWCDELNPEKKEPPRP